ncbi:Rieske 2Fe-2S domain-containing protein [Rhizorhabdus histidinilytica]
MSTRPCRFMERYPEEGRDPIPVERYTSPDYFNLERERIFRRKWLNVGHILQAPKPGDYFVADLKILDTSLLVIHGKDGQYRAFHNMCSHRGAPVAWDAQGSCKGYLACRFHGWVYDTTGKLVQISDAANFPGVKAEENGLTPVHCAVWKGFVFVNMAAEPEETLLDYLGPVAEEVGRFDFEGFTPAFSYRIDENVNWKTLQEAQLEGWHLPYLHEKTLARAVKVDGNQYRHAAIELHGLHGVLGSPPPDSFTLRRPRCSPAASGRARSRRSAPSSTAMARAIASAARSISGTSSRTSSWGCSTGCSSPSTSGRRRSIAACGRSRAIIRR